jgi:hypothetical protein
MKRISKIFIFILYAITIAIGIYFFPQAREGMNMNVMGLYLTWVYIVFGITVLLIFILPLFSTSPRAFKRMALSVGFLVVVLGLSYLLGSGTLSEKVLAMENPPTSGTMRFIDVYLIGTYIMLVLALLSLAFSSVIGAIRKR